MIERILVTGACGQIGSELVPALCRKYGSDAVVATDVHDSCRTGFDGKYLPLNILDKKALAELIRVYDVKQVYHLAAVLSASGEAKPLQSWELNMHGLINVLEVAREHGLEKVFWPSSIAVFGPSSGKTVQQNSLTDPLTAYGISKVAGEQWCRYYFLKYGLDVRSIRYPGLISYSAPPGGGTTDYAVAIFHEALEDGRYTCFLKNDTALPMMYMSDAIRATIGLMDAPAVNVRVRTSYNLASMDFTPDDLAMTIRKYVPDFKISYAPDFRQQIADSWPSRVIDAEARSDWGWEPQVDLGGMVKDMIKHISEKLTVSR